MEIILKTGRVFYGLCIAIIGFNQLVYGDFRNVILPPWPSWRIEASFAAYVTGVLPIGAGLVMAFWSIPLAIAYPHRGHGNEWASAADALGYSGIALMVYYYYKERKIASLKPIS